MAVFQFSALSDGQAISFNASADRLNFDQTTIAAGDLTLTTEGSGVRVTVKSGPQAGKDVLLTGFTLEQIAATNFSFADGSFARVGDNNIGTAGDAGNNGLTGGVGRDLLMGLGGNDNLQAGDGNDSLIGGTGNDTVSGNNGNDWLDGSAGNDTLNGGGGQDAFILRDLGAANADLLADFGTGWDNVQLDAATMTQLGAAGRFVAGDARFFAGTAAHDADDRIVYNSATGQIFYDADGNGAGAAQLIGTLGAGRSVTATDFWVFGSPGAAGGGETINGTAANETLSGGAGNDTIRGGAGDDSLSGLGGDDVLDGQLGNDTLVGGAGADVFAFSVPPERSIGSNDADYDRLPDFVSGTDRIQLDGTVFQAIGASGSFAADDPRFHVGWDGMTSETRVIYDPSTGFLFYDFDGSGTGNGRIFAHLTAEPALSASDFTVINGNTAPMTVNGTPGDDELVGGPGNDTINGFGGNDSLFGVGGNDSLSGGDGHDLLDGGDGHDTLNGGEGDGSYYGGAGNDVYIGGNSGREDFHVEEGNDRVETGGGSENVITVEGFLEYGDDTLVGGASRDVLNMGAHSAVTVDMRAGLLTGGSQSGGGSISFSGIDYFGISTNHSVHFTADDSGVEAGTGGNGDDTFIGGAGDDQFGSAAGNDVFIGGRGADTMSASGSGQFVFNTAAAPAEADTIFNFETGIDSLHFDASVFTALGAGGQFAAGDERFYAAAGATSGHDTTDRLVYDSNTGNLWYDADGSGSGASVLVANLPRDTGGADVYAPEATDIWVDGSSGGGGQTINGTEGNDSLVGTPDNDTINGFGGNDTIDGAGGADLMNGGAGNDLYFVDIEGDLIVEAENGGIDEVRSHAQHYTLPDFVNNLTLLEINSSGTGNAIDNVITGDNSFNVLRGLGGNDTLIGGGIASGETADTYLGGTGNDSMVGSDAGDVFYLLADTTTSYGQDTIIGGGEPGDVMDVIFAETSDWLATTGIVVDLAAGTLTGGHAGSSVTLSDIEDVYGTRFADRFVGDADRNEFDGGDGNDTLNGGAGNDRLSGGAGADSFLFSNAAGAANADNVVGFETGVDKIRLDGSVMTALGASGNFAAGDARFFAGAAAHDADDRVIFDGTMLWYDPDGTGAAAQQAITELQTGTLVATDIAVDNGSSGGGTINGTAGNDSLVGGAGNDTINGNAGNDTLRGNAGDDSLDGGSGTDLLDGGTGNDIYVVSAGDTLTDAGGIDQIYSPVSWSLGAGFENIELVGTASGLTVSGNFMSNTIIGNNTANTLRGRDGNDTITGNGGADFFDFITAPSAGNADTITDFTSVDQLRFEDAAHAGIGATGTWGATDGRFWASTTGVAHDANDRVIYNTTSGQLYYDADGSGAGAAQLVATLQGAPTLSATDITVI